MAIKTEEETVTVSDDSSGISADASSSVGAIVLKGSDLDALSDDPDELQNELDALAGPSAGPNGGQLYVDGFTGVRFTKVHHPRDSHQPKSFFR